MSVRSLISTTRAALGFVVPDEGRFRFTATDPRLGELDGEVFDSAHAAEHPAEAVLAAGGSPARQALLALLERMPHRPVPAQSARP